MDNVLEQHFAAVWEVMSSGIERGITTEGVQPGKLRVPRRAAALRRMHLPESIIIPCAVVVRFFPTVGEDYRHIRAAMALRGIAAGRVALLRHPVQSLEYILMPLLMNSNNVAQDLSAAALTKGIGLPGRHTCMTELRLTAWDFLYPALCTLPLLWKVVTLL